MNVPVNNFEKYLNKFQVDTGLLRMDRSTQVKNRGGLRSTRKLYDRSDTELPSGLQISKFDSDILALTHLPLLLALRFITIYW